MSDKKLIKLAGIWKNQSKGGKTFFSGTFGQEVGNVLQALSKDPGQFRLSIFKNDFKKEGDRSPDMQLYVSKKQPKAAPPPANSDPFGGDEDPFGEGPPATDAVESPEEDPFL